MMRISVAFVPALARQAEGSVCIVIDVLRASSTLVTMFDRGCRVVVVTPDVASARAGIAGDRLLGGGRARLAAAGSPPRPEDSALAALALVRESGAGSGSAATTPADRALLVFRQADSGRHLAKLGLWADVEHCARFDVSTTVPC